MPAQDAGPGSAQDRTAAQLAAFRAAMEAGDSAAVSRILAADVVLRGPVISGAFSGREEVGAVLAVLLERFEINYTDQLLDAGIAALVFRGRIGGRDVEGVELLRFNEEGLVSEFTTSMRPLAGVAALGSLLGPGLATRLGGGPPGAVRMLSAPLRGLTELADRIGGRLVGQGAPDR